MADWLWYSAGTNLIEVFGSIQSAADGPPSLVSVNGPETCWKKPISPSKSGAGPVMPSAASSAAKRALRDGERERAAFPHRELAGAGEPQGGAGGGGDAQGVHGLLVGELQEHGGGERGRDRAVGGVVPAAGADARGVAEPALDFVGDGGRGDPGACRRRRRAGRRP